MNTEGARYEEIVPSLEIRRSFSKCGTFGCFYLSRF